MPRRTRTRYEQVLVAGIALCAAAMAYLLLRPEPPVPEAQVVVDALCRTIEQAGTDRDAALATFDQGAHAALHQLDDDLQPVDPELALRLATEKIAVERALATGAGDVAALTTTLTATTMEGYRTLDVDVADCR